jgi:hypothetical protein
MKKICCDDASAIGADHVAKGMLCQDYAMSDTYAGTSFAVVSDGCSSGGLTDVGARLVCLAARRASHLWNLEDLGQVESSLRQMLGANQRLLDLEPRDMWATCVYARVDGQKVSVVVLGDGVVAAEYRDGSQVAYKFDWSGNQPPYPFYDEAYRDQLRRNGATLSLESVLLRRAADRPSDDEGEDEHSCSYPLDGSLYVRTLSFDVNGLRSLAIFTDGVCQVEEKVEEVGSATVSRNVSWRDVVSSLLSFKNCTGAFARRRLGAYLNPRRGLRPLDDLSYAAICLVDEEE